MPKANPIRLCECGCGHPTPLAKQTSKRDGTVRGQPVRFIANHHFRKHGHTRAGWQSPTYQSWYAMIKRCEKPNTIGYSEYGGRGISVCDRWHDFANFLADMGEKPDGLSLDRYPDNDGNYEPGNCRWATPQQQADNRRPKRDSTYISAFGKRQTLQDWSRETGIHRTTIASRLRAGRKPEHALAPKGEQQQ